MPLALIILLAANGPALDRAATWMAAFPSSALRFDAAVGLSQLQKLHDSEAVRAAFARARAVADRDDDHPQRRLWASDAGTTKAAVTSWSPDQGKVNYNRVVDEALWCDVHGLRPATVAYASGPMRDSGGYGSTHALWALTLARDRGCLDAAVFAKASAALRTELRKTQPATIGPATRDVDLYAERLLMLRLAGERDATLEQWAAKLLARQNADGSWGDTADASYYRFHATLVAAWALAL